MSSGILYLHGFRSSPSSRKARLLGAAMAARGQADRFFCPALSPVPDEAIAQAEAIIRENGRGLTLVGSSLGGYYATCLAERYGMCAALVNPAVDLPAGQNSLIGRHTNLHTGQTFEFTHEHVAQLLAMAPATVTPAHYLLMVETGDEVLDYRQAVARYADCRQLVFDGGDHGFTRFAEMLPQLFEFCGL